MLGVLLGSLAAVWHVHDLRASTVARLAAHRADVDLVARLVRDPIASTAAVGLTIVDATATSVHAEGWRRASSPILVLSYSDGWTGLLPGQRVELTGRLEAARRGDDVAAVLDARGPPIAIGVPPWWQRLAGRARAALRRACGGLPVDERGLLPGLVDGDVSDVPPSLQTDMRLTGLTHLEAVSGENVSVVLAVTLALARALGVRRRTRIAVAATALTGFVVLARPSPSVLRAAVMGGVALFVLAVGRKVRPIRLLAFAVLGLVLVNPFLARTVGFGLSVCATAALLLVAPGWTDRLARHMPRPLAVAIAVPAAAQLACTPLLVMTFGQLTPYAVPANLLAAPAVVPATILGVVCALLATLVPVLAPPVAWLAALATAVIALVARSLAGLPGAGLRWPGAPPVAVVAVGLVVVIAIARRYVGRASQPRDILGRWPP